LPEQLDRTDIAGFFALRALAAFERNALVFGQGFEAATLNVLKMREQVVAAAVRGNKSKTLWFVEPLYDASLITHVFSLIKNEMGCALVTLETKMETAGNQTGMALKEQDGKETDNNNDLMQVQRSIYRQTRGSPSHIRFNFASVDPRASIDAFHFFNRNNVAMQSCMTIYWSSLRRIFILISSALERGAAGPVFDMAECNPAFAQVIRRQFKRYLVACQNLDMVLPHFSRRVRDQLMTVLKGNAKARIR
jgi:hypothetical protein